jgi:hypothetical protein
MKPYDLIKIRYQLLLSLFVYAWSRPISFFRFHAFITFSVGEYINDNRHFTQKLHEGFHASIPQIVTPKLDPYKAYTMIDTKYTITSRSYSFY